MSKDGSGRSSAAGSVRANSPEISADPAEPEPQQSVDDTSAKAQIPVVSTELKKSTITSDIPSRVAESQPMTASNSTSSHPSTKDAPPSNGTASIPYGTRSSRNRTGASRPNYAEDKELDMEFEVSSVRENSGRKGKTAMAEQANADTSRQTVSTRKPADSEIDQPPSVQNIKDPIPGTSTFSAKPASSTASTGSKKRKAISQPSLAQSQSQAQSQILNTPRPSVMAHSLGGLQDSNMLSFEGCGAQLNEGNQLVADDGTVLEVNGNINTNHYTSLRDTKC
jgi:hypothetical protein